MRKLVAFMQVSLDGCFAAANGDIRWAHKDQQDGEWNAFVAGNAGGGGTLLFGRVTYEMMASYWPSAAAAGNDSVVAKGMNEMPKIVFSTTLESVSWQNTLLLTGNLVAEIRRLKQEPGANLAILGSGSLVAQLAPAGLIDEYQIVVNPIVLGDGQRLFGGIEKALPLTLTRTRRFNNGNVLLCYEPAA